MCTDDLRECQLRLLVPCGPLSNYQLALDLLDSDGVHRWWTLGGQS